MAPTTPLKRPSPSDSPQSDPEGPILKKRRIDPYLPQTPPAESVEDRSEDGYGKAHNTEESHDEALPSENMEMDITMKRSIAIALKHVGFESSSKEALESFFILTQRYVSEMMSGIMVSTTTCRRPMPIFQDYEYTFDRMKIDPLTLIPHTKLPRGLPPLRAQHLPQDPPRPPNTDFISELNPELSGAADKEAKPYIPKKFPIFPPLQTYKFTGYFSFQRSQDISKIREKGAEDRRHMEGVLHRQLDERKNRGRIRKSGHNVLIRKGQNLFEAAMKETAGGEESAELNVSTVNAAVRHGYLRNSRRR